VTVLMAGCVLSAVLQRWKCKYKRLFGLFTTWFAHVRGRSYPGSLWICVCPFQWRSVSADGEGEAATEMAPSRGHRGGSHWFGV